MPEVNERRIALHEAGHVVVAHAESVVVERVTIESDTTEEGAGGVWFNDPEEPTENDLTALGRIAWGGHVAESLVFDSARANTWALDARWITELATENGEKAAPLYFGEEERKSARQVLKANRYSLDEATRLLLKHQTMRGELLTRILNG